ncbi:MAG: hypothetical protein HW406_124 [Candidatus Brocadiaceae bacterium]|nr:hypothetical protein [Candidatus Brocadiaceae bacterium]
MSLLTKFLGLVFLVLSQVSLFNGANLSADDSWKNIYGIAWNGTPDEAIKYSKQMGYDYIALKQGPYNKNKYAINPDKAGLKFYIVGPKELQDMNPVVGRQVIDIANAGTYTTTVKEYYNRYFAWKSMDAFPHNLAASWYYNNGTQFRPAWDIQQQAVIDYLVPLIVTTIKGYEDKNAGFTFAGTIYDIPTLSGEFVNWDTVKATYSYVNLTYWTGSDSSLIHDSITHEYSTFTEANAAFYKQVNAALKQEWPDAKWIIEPYSVYASYLDRNDWVYQIKNRADKNELTPDLILQESAGTQFVDDSNNFNSGVNVTPGMVGSTQAFKVEENLNRLYAAKAGINGAWYNWFGIWGNRGTMPNFASVTDIYPRLKLIRCIPNWDNLNGIAISSRSWNNSTTDPIYNSYDIYNNQQSCIDGNVMYSRHPKAGKLFAVFLTTSGVINLKAGEVVDSVQRTDGYFVESGEASADFDITGAEIRLKGNVSIDVDSTNGQIKGNGYIFTLWSDGSPKVSTGPAGNVTSNSAVLNGTVNAQGLSATAWVEYGVVSGSYTGKSATQNINGSTDTTVSFSIGGLSEAKTYYYRLVAQNSVGTTDGSEMSFDTKDATAPNCSVSINSGTLYTKSTSATLTLSATDNVGVTGYYPSTNATAPSASGAGWISVSSTTSYSTNIAYTLSSGDGSKTVYVWYKDASGNVSNTTSDSITLDMTVPSITITSPTTGSTYTSTSSTISIGGVAADNTSGVSSVTWSNDRGGSGTASGTTSWLISGITLSNGDNIITVVVTDRAGNTRKSTITVTYGLVAPKTTTGSATSVASNSAVLNGIVNPRGLSTSAWFEYGVTSGSYVSMSAKQSASGTSDTTVSVSIIGLSEAKTYYYRLVAQNSVGITYGNEMFFTTPDRTVPNGSASINKGAGATKGTYAIVSLSATDNVGITGYYLSASSAKPLASAAGWTTVSSAASFKVDAVYYLSSGDGSKTVYVWYKDAAGNVSNTTHDSIILDMTAPSVTITSPTSGSTYTSTSSKINLGGSALDSTTGVIRVTWSNSTGGSGTASGTTSWSISGIILLSGQPNVITVTAQDIVGNIRTDTISVSM